jgi:hypothetical protein
LIVASSKNDRERMTPAFQAALAGMVTNDRLARLYFDGSTAVRLPALAGADLDALQELGRRSEARLMTLASLLSQRRFRRATQLLPASRQILGSKFDAHWQTYLETAEPGMPSATEEAVSYAAHLRATASLSRLAEDVVRYEESLNEASRRLVGRSSPAESPPIPMLADDDGIRLSTYVLLQAFDHDVIALVKALRDSADLPAGADGASERSTILFRPKQAEGVAVDVSRLPEVLAECLRRIGAGTRVADLLEGFAAEIRPALRSRLQYLVQAGIVVTGSEGGSPSLANG